MEGNKETTILKEDEGLSQQQVVKTYTEEEVELIKKKMQSDTDRGVQKVLQEKSIYEQVLNEIPKVGADKKYLVELSIDKPEVAKAILDKFYGGQSIEQFKDEIGYDGEYDDKIVEKRIEERVQKELTAKRIESAKNDFIEKLKMNSEEKEKFLEAFEERTTMKSFSVDSINTHLEKAYREIADETTNKKTHEDSVVASMMATTTSTSETVSQKEKKDNDMLRKQIRDIFSKY